MSVIVATIVYSYFSHGLDLVIITVTVHVLLLYFTCVYCTAISNFWMWIKNQIAMFKTITHALIE